MLNLFAHNTFLAICTIRPCKSFALYQSEIVFEIVNLEAESVTLAQNYLIMSFSEFQSSSQPSVKLKREKRHLPLITVVNHRPLIGVENPVKTTPS